jgi:uncharacterized membrane protein
MTILRFLKPAQAAGGRFPEWLWWAYWAAALLYTVPPIVLYLFYRQPGFDLGIYDQTIWLLANGERFNTVAGIHVFGAHFSPVLFLLAPLSWIPGGAIPELVFEGLFVACAVFPIYSLATDLKFHQRPLVLLGTIHPGVFGALWWGVRPWNLAYPVVLFAALWILRRPRWSTIAIFGLAAVLIREDVGLWIGLVALILTLAGRVPWHQLVIGGAVVGGASAIVLLALLPRWSPVGTYLYESAVLGGSDATWLKRVASAFARLVFLLLPVILVTRNLRRLRWRLALPLLVPIAGLAQRGAGSLSLGFHYDLLLVAVVVLIVALSPSVQLDFRPVALGALLGAVAAGVLNPLTRDVGANPFGIRIADAHVQNEIADEIRLIDDGSRSISAPKSLITHFSEREQAFIFPYPFDAPYVEPYPMNCPLPEVVAAPRAGFPAPGWDRVRDNHYRFITSSGNVSLYEISEITPQSGECGPGLPD